MVSWDIEHWGQSQKAKQRRLGSRDLKRKGQVCPKCGGKVTKNGTYWVLNWVRLLLLGWLGEQRVRIQRRRCRDCGHEIISPERALQAEARRAWWVQVNCLVGLSRFKLGLSVRKIQTLVKFVYARPVSIGHIDC